MTSGRRRSGAALGGVLAVLLAVPALALRDVFAVDEPRYVRIAMEMAERGDFLLPRLGGEVYADKPPLLFWLALLAAPLTGWANGLPLRLVSLAAGVATVALTARLAARGAGERAGRFAGCVLALVPLQLALSQAAMFDTLLALGVTIAWSGLAATRPVRGAIAIGLGLSIGLLAKGPMALALTVPGAVLFRVLDAPPRARLRSLRPGRASAIAALVTIAGAGAWYVPAVVAGGSDYLRDTLLGQTIGRAAAGSPHERPFWFYALLLPLAAFPFSLALPAALRRAARGEALDRLALAWSAAGLVALSLIAGKQIHYLAPILPPIAILTGRSLAERDLSARAFGVAAALGALAAGALLFGPALLDASSALEDLEPERRRALASLAPAGAALALAILAVLAARRVRPALPRATIAFAIPIALALALPLASAPSWNAIGSGRALGAAIRAQVGSPDALALYRVGRNGSWALFSGLGTIPFFHDFDAFRAFVLAPESRVRFIACREKDVGAVASHLGAPLEVVAAGWNDWDREALCRILR